MDEILFFCSAVLCLANIRPAKTEAAISVGLFAGWNLREARWRRRSAPFPPRSPAAVQGIRRNTGRLLVRLSCVAAAPGSRKVFRPSRDLQYLVYVAVPTSHARILRTAKQPLKSFRQWALAALTQDRITQLARAATQQQFDQLVDQLHEELIDHWLMEHGQVLKYGRGRKLVDMLLKHVVRYAGITDVDRSRLIRFLHIPLDVRVLRMLRICGRSGQFGPLIHVRHDATAATIVDGAAYGRLQELAREVAALVELPPICIDLIQPRELL